MCNNVNSININDVCMDMDVDTCTELEACDKFQENLNLGTLKSIDLRLASNSLEFDGTLFSDENRLVTNSTQTLFNLNNITEIYRIMSRDTNLIINNRLSDCVSASNKFLHNSSNIVVYSGLCKTKQIINDLMMNNVTYVIAYNIREITILETKKTNYLLKIKTDGMDIGIDKNDLKKIYMGNMAKGVYINISKKRLIDEILLTGNKRLDPNSYDIYRLMTTYVTNILNILIRNNVKLKYVVLDIFDEYNNQDNLNQSIVMFKMSIFNYIVNYEIHDCSVY